MRSNKLVAITMGTALLGATSLVGIAATASQAAPATRPVPAPVTDTLASDTRSSDTAAAATPVAQRTPESALTETRNLIDNGVPGAEPELDAQLKQALCAAEQAVKALQAHASAQEITRSWVRTVQPRHTVQLPGVSALAQVYGLAGGSASGTPAAPAAPAEPRAAAPSVGPLPDLSALLGAVTSLDVAGTLGALTQLVGDVLATLTGTVFGITGSLTGLAGAPATDAAAPATPPALTALPEAAAEESETPAVTDAAALLNSADVQEAAALAQLPGFPAFPNLPGMPTTP